MNDGTVMSIFQLMRLIRDARSTKNADRALLNAIALRCSPKKKFLAWPSYSQLALDTCLDKNTLKRASRRLEAAGLIKRRVRRDQSNHYFINVPLLIEQAEAIKAAESIQKASDDECPFQPLSTVTEDDYESEVA